MDPSKPLLAMIAVLAGGLTFIAYNHMTAAEGNVHYGMIPDKHKLIAYSKIACRKAIQLKLNAEVATPSSIRSDDVHFVELSWDTQRDTSKRITCRYEAEKGVTDLSIDGKSLGAVSVDIGAIHAPGSAGEKRGGHY
ncbi:hypothetical protein [Methylococcus sp. EFPC2]|uniref:hypothetical protein n=1 Tax=Methylococcus sp. EFPC2 TaxID=2812648 RepID=UPI0019687A74|nr:hypothetical protein [Methylococcus sp. EFPC2]QSA97576.1 hypothetical protein JWZ97_01655 [Methylococcus sp. EFPC2]